jgi:DHA3 family macrolide efflux protein-like MFS transporter
MQAFQSPAAGASTAMLVPEHFLTRAAGLNQTLQGIMTIAAAPLGALALSFLPIGWALAIDVVTAILGILPLLVFSIPQTRAPAGVSFVADLKIGVLTVWRNPGLSRLYGLMALVVMCVMPSFTLVPLLVKEHFGGGVNEVAVMEGLAGVGMIVGGAVAALLVPRRKVLWVLGGFAGSSFLLGFVGLMPTSGFWVAVGLWAMSGVAYTMGAAPMTALIQSVVPNELQGRALSLLTTLMALAAPLGLAVAAPIGEAVGIRWLFFLMGASSGLVMLAGFLSRELREMEGRTY